MERRKDTPQRIIRRRYEEKHSVERKEKNKVWGTSLGRKYVEEMDAFLKENKLTKVDLICAGYESLKKSLASKSET